MPASDAAPLPRAGEVFFDVRGHARTMRVSWYGDTGVAVFSIWNGGTCTGTFRLPIPELPRMIDALSHGPGGAAPLPAGARASRHVPGAGYRDPAHQDTWHGYPDGPQGYGAVQQEYAGGGPGYGAPPPRQTGGRPGYGEPGSEYSDYGAPGSGYEDGPPGAGHAAPQAGPGRPYYQPAAYASREPATGGYDIEAEPPYPGPGIDELGADPLEADYGGEAEQGYLPGPPTETFSPVAVGGSHGSTTGRPAGPGRAGAAAGGRRPAADDPQDADGHSAYALPGNPASESLAYHPGRTGRREREYPPPRGSY